MNDTSAQGILNYSYGAPQAALTIKVPHDQTVVFASEVGSRAWGWSGADSDFDVRYLFLYNTPGHYRSIFRRAVKDTFEADVQVPGLMRDVDLVGWELPKALNLWRKNNVTLYEWLMSPTVYKDMDNDGLMDQLLSVLDIYDPREIMAHYIGVAHSAITNIVGRDDLPNGPKKYLFALRSLLAAAHIYRTDGDLPPLDLLELMEDSNMPDPVEEAADMLLQLAWKGEGSPDPYLLERMEKYFVASLPGLWQDRGLLSPRQQPSEEVVSATYDRLLWSMLDALVKE